MKSLIEREQERIETSLSQFKTFRVENHTLQSISELLVESKEPEIDATIRLVDNNYFERSDGNIRGLIGTIEATELVKLITDVTR